MVWDGTRRSRATPSRARRPAAASASRASRGQPARWTGSCLSARANTRGGAYLVCISGAPAHACASGSPPATPPGARRSQRTPRSSSGPAGRPTSARRSAPLSRPPAAATAPRCAAGHADARHSAESHPGSRLARVTLRGTAAARAGGELRQGQRPREGLRPVPAGLDGRHVRDGAPPERERRARAPGFQTAVEDSGTPLRHI